MKANEMRPHFMPPLASRCGAGFTLVEVLVALAIVALALLAGIQASNSLVLNATRQTDALLGQLCAENVLVNARLAARLEGTGQSTQNCEQAGRTLQVRMTVTATLNPNFKRVQVQVLDESGYSMAQLVTVQGNY